MSDTRAGEVMDAIHSGCAIVCHTRCYPCMFGQHEGGEHTWADQDDIKHAKSTGQPDPSKSVCGCPCVTDPSMVNAPEMLPPDPDAPPLGTPCPLCGEAGACDYDMYGRPLIHAISEDDDA